MRPAVPLPGTNCNSIPRSQARRRTAGEAMGLSRGWGVVCATAAGAGAVDGAAGLAPGALAAAGAAGLAAAAGAAGVAGARVAAAVAARLRTLPAPSTSMRMSSLPTAITSPSLPPSASTVPATGEGISTVALSVITSARLWSSVTASPGCTCHATSSTSAMPSPMSGILITCTPIVMRSIARLNAAATRAGPGEIVPLLRMRIGRVPAGHALDRRFEVIEAVLLHQRRELGAEAAGARGLVHDDAAAGLRHRVDQRVEIQRPDAAQVDDLGVDAGLDRRRLRHEHHRAVGEHRQLAAGSEHAADSSGTV